MLTKKGRKRTFGGPVKKEFFQPGDLVFAKVKGHPHWPCIIDTVDEAKSLKAKRYHIFFFGTHETALLAVENIWPYEENKDRFSNPKARKHFTESLAEIQTYQMLLDIGKKVFRCFNLSFYINITCIKCIQI